LATGAAATGIAVKPTVAAAAPIRAERLLSVIIAFTQKDVFATTGA
jgi:hypothetical protein